MSDIRSFLQQQGPNIITVVVVFLTLLVLFAILGVNFDPVVDKHVEKVVTIESFGPSSRAESACDRFHDDPKKIDGWCQSLSKKGCVASSCCVLLNGNKCVGGSKSGPTFHTSNGKDVDYDHYHHRDNCIGNCPK
jgi:hypothetical protein